MSNISSTDIMIGIYTKTLVVAGVIIGGTVLTGLLLPSLVAGGIIYAYPFKKKKD